MPKREIDACPAQAWLRDFADPLGTLYAPFYGPSIRPTGNPNQRQVNVPAIIAAMAKAALILAPAARYVAWAKIDEMLVDDAVAVREDFDSQPNIESKDVAGVDDLWKRRHLGLRVYVVEEPVAGWDTRRSDSTQTRRR